MKEILSIILMLFSYSITFSSNGKSGAYLVRCNEKLVSVVMEDVFTPPVASRVHVYPNIAAYEVLCKKDKSMHSYSKKLKDLDSIPNNTEIVDFSLSALVAFTTVAKKLVYSEYMITDFEKAEYEMWLSTNKNDSILFYHSIDYGKTVAGSIILWLKNDQYDYTRTLSRYVLSDAIGAWQPTQPDYANALEPNWPLMRSFVFDSLTRLRPLPPVPYSEKKNSEFYKLGMEVYNQSITLDTVKKEIAAFWDCNPNITKSAGHFTYFVHKVSPGGHWILIAGQACDNLFLDEFQTSRVYSLLTIGLFESIISCWTEKYKENTIRPETYINRLIAPTWKPYIETPPFPEYTSGHSTLSSTSATILTALIPQPYSFNDSSEMYINLAPRHFNNFREAADEASISRFYGGIHFMPALTNGITHGKEIGIFILKKLN